MYSALEMLYATHVIEGKRDIESVPASIRENVKEIVMNAKSQKKQISKIFFDWDNRFYRRLSFILKQRGNVDGSVGSD